MVCGILFTGCWIIYFRFPQLVEFLEMTLLEDEAGNWLWGIRVPRDHDHCPIDPLLVNVFTGADVLRGTGLVVDGFPLDFEIDGQTVLEALEFQLGLEIG